MDIAVSLPGKRNIRIIKWLTFLMFLMFAMTTDAVGKIIPEVMKQFDLSMTAAGLLHYGPMVAIALAGMFLGFLADRIGRKRTIILGLLIFVISSYLFIIGKTFAFYAGLLMISGMAIGVFKTGALALIGDISTSTKEHTSTMNYVEGFFGVGAIIGPFIVTWLLEKGIEWKWLYVIAATLCILLILMASAAKYPTTTHKTEEPVNLMRTFSMLKDPFALGFSLAAFLYVATEAAIYVWMPTLIEGYAGSFQFWAVYSLSIFFIFRAGGRFLGEWVLSRFHWTSVLAVFSLAILLCFVVSIFGDPGVRVIALPLTGIFMSVMYPTINSKGISCFPKVQHGAVAGIILFFTAAGAALGPLSMAAVSDAFGKNALYGFMLATVFSALLFAGALYNWIKKPTEERLAQIEKSEY
ncbi:MAG: MFS transporter [Lewinellaceae bacterium]|nr:MFS transporter [Lewinellaceae bacterium]